MKTVTRKFSFDAAHMLPGYKGKCCNLHGHTYKLEVVVGEGDTKGEYGMVLDFNSLKSAVEQLLMEYDHAFLYGVSKSGIISGPESRVLDAVQSLNLKATPIRGYSSTECIAEQIKWQLEKLYGWRVVRLRLGETDSTSVEVEN